MGDGLCPRRTDNDARCVQRHSSGPGEQLNEAYCAGCHEDGYFQGAFLAAWRDQPASGLFDLLRATMPQDDPGLLTDAEYVDLLAYIFALNGLPEGQSTLDPKTLDQLIIQAP